MAVPASAEPLATVTNLLVQNRSGGKHGAGWAPEQHVDRYGGEGEVCSGTCSRGAAVGGEVSSRLTDRLLSSRCSGGNTSGCTPPRSPKLYTLMAHAFFITRARWDRCGAAAPPHPTPSLETRHDFFCFLQVDVENPDLERFPKFAEAPFLSCVLSPGELLFIPVKHWHYVRALDLSFSVSFWWS